jgi:hypothetical protein
VCIVISLWIIYLAFIVVFSLGLVEDRVIGAGVSFDKLLEDSWNYSRTWCLGLIPILKVCILARIVLLPVGVTIMLGLCNPPV